jgi:hypothetical protein
MEEQNGGCDSGAECAAIKSAVLHHSYVLNKLYFPKDLSIFLSV